MTDTSIPNVDPAVAEAIQNTEQAAWAASPEGQAYIAAHDEREAAAHANAQASTDAAARQTPAPIQETFSAEAPEAPVTPEAAPVIPEAVAPVAEAPVAPVAPADLPAA